MSSNTGLSLEMEGKGSFNAEEKLSFKRRIVFAGDGEDRAGLSLKKNCPSNAGLEWNKSGV